MPINPSDYWPTIAAPIRNGEVANEVRWWQRFFKPVSNSFDQITADDTGWTNVPVLSNSWVLFGSPWPTAGYRRRRGIVFVRGLVKSGTAGAIFQLPAGFRPSQNQIYVAISNTGSARIDVDSAGNIAVQAYASGGSNAFVELSSIHFVAEQ